METRIYDWLLNVHRIKVPMEWLTACVEWLRNEHINSDNFAECVYQQWLLADLHELASECLPSNLKQNKYKEINGFFPLQIDSLLDISQSSYQQHLRINGCDHSNSKVSAEQDKKVENSKHRLLQLKLTDGCQDVIGLEYQPVPTLNSYLPPGTKLMIKGQVCCRNGILLLTKENVTVLGGEASELAECNTLSKILEDNLKAIKNFGSGTFTSPLHEIKSEARSNFSNISKAIVQTMPESTINTNVLSSCSAEAELDWGADDDFLTVDLKATNSSFVSNSNEVSRSPSISQIRTFESSSDNEFETLLSSTKNANQRLQSPFTYLDALPSLSSETPLKVTIKGFISSVLSCLGTDNNKGWKFSAMINDGTSSISVDFSSEILTKLIGTTVEELKMLKITSRSNYKEIRNNILGNFRRQILDLCCLFEIEIQPQQTFAKVINIVNVNKEIFQSLKSSLYV